MKSTLKHALPSLAWLAISFLLSSCGASGGVDSDVVYTPKSWPKELKADVYHPPKGGLSPAVLLIHGGGWKEEDGRWQMKSIARKLARRGYVVMNVTYRGAPAFHYPAPVDDLREALGWMRRNAKTQGIDPHRIATFGYSAGGHLASMVGLEDHGVKAIVAGGGPFDLTLYPGGDLVPAFLGGTQKEIPKRFREASPVNHVTHASPPIFIYHGSRDTLVPPEHARRMQAAYQRAGAKSEIHWLAGRSHITTFLFSGGTVSQAIDFLDRTVK